LKTLLILRHAKSSWSDNNLSDHQRPLNKRGRYDAPRMGDLLASEDLVPDLIISSSATRARTTAEAVADASGYDGQLIITRELYHAGPDDYLAAARELGADSKTVLVVGHNPGIEELVEQLAGAWYRMPTAALAEVRLSIKDWADLSEDENGELANLWLPRELP